MHWQGPINQIVCHMHRIQPYREMLTYKPLTNNAVQEIEVGQYLLFT